MLRTWFAAALCAVASAPAWLPRADRAYVRPSPHSGWPSRPRRGLAVAALIGVYCVAPSSAAQDYQANIVPFAGGLSPWGGASSPIAIDQFIGAQWNASTPPINLSLTACADVPVIGNQCVGYGVDGNASTSGKLGFQFGLHADGGEVTLGLPMTVGLNINPGIQGLTNTSVSLPTNPATLSADSTYLTGSGGTAVLTPFVRSTAPTFDARMDAVLDLGFAASGHICYVYCLSGDVGDHLDKTVNLFNIGKNAQGGYDASILGSGVSLPIETGTDLVRLGLNVPNVSTDSKQRGGFDLSAGTVTSMADDWLLGLKLDLATLVGDLFPILSPFLGARDLGSVGSYELLSATVGVLLRYVEEFTARINDVAVALFFSDPVSVNNAPAAQFAVLHPGDDASIVAGDLPFGSLGVWPVFFTQAAVHHQPSLVPALVGAVDVLKFELAGHEFGPVAHADFSYDIAKFDLPPVDFLTNYIPVSGMPFNLYPAPDPGNATLCIADGCTHHEFRTTRGGCTVGITNLGICNALVGDDNVWLVDGSCPQNILASACPGAIFLGHTDTSVFTDSSRADQIFTNVANFDFGTGQQGPVLGDLYASNWLAQGGFTGDVPPFGAFPAFEFPFAITASVPEPHTLALVVGSLLLLVASRRVAPSRGHA